MNRFLSFPCLHHTDGDPVDEDLLAGHFLVFELVPLQGLQLLEDLDLVRVLLVLLEEDLAELLLNLSLGLPLELLESHLQLLLEFIDRFLA